MTTNKDQTPRHLTVQEQIVLVNKIIEMLGIPPLVSYLKIEWSMEQSLTVECNFFPHGKDDIDECE